MAGGVSGKPLHAVGVIRRRHFLSDKTWPSRGLSRITVLDFMISTEAVTDTSPAALPANDANEVVIPWSKVLWGIDWSDHLPVTLPGTDIVVVASSYDQALPFIREHYAAIFQEDPSSPFVTKVTPQKARYYRVAGDFFEFKDGEETIGLFVGTPVDWGTYYIRSVSLLPEYQGRRLTPKLLTYMFGRLAAVGVERIEAEASPVNRATMKVLLGLRFGATGTSITDRWGAFTKFTRYLDAKCEAVFLRQFVSGSSQSDPKMRRNSRGHARLSKRRLQ